ncbi:HAMP domain-containing histidine kinase [Halolamina sp. CBA1230]|uniref:sensor histidine kinase n=1 Tax=Halolamina sp. CBA1230 TaxID=1853690 RepID=UPI001301AB26|nr:HAMP domain-containing sensor histidine kinase [Halolamina sp. CBA1230]QKY19618.1 HAMP domain-containing histidine kinase [Halolamina sp. CBA1230]
MYVVGFVTSLPGLVGLLGGGVYLSRSSLSGDQQYRVLKWSVAGGGGFLLVNTVLMLTMPPANLLIAVGWGRWSLSIGAGCGFLIGYYEARAVQRAVRAERASVQARESEERREMLDYLNSLLRHEVLNTAAVISGYAGLLKQQSSEDDPVYEYLDIIDRQATELTGTTKDVRLLLQSLEEGTDLGPVNLTDVLAEEVDNLEDRYRNVEIDAKIPDDVYVTADELLPRIFSNLLNNAVEHNESEQPRVSLSVSTTPDTVEVRVADNGSGVPETERDVLFETATAKTDHGIGLTIVARLADRYGGDVELSETGSDGSVFAVTLPRADSEPVEKRRQPQSVPT